MRPPRRSLWAAALLLAGVLRGDFEMTVPMTVSLPSISGPITLSNRQGAAYTQAGWNNDYFEVVALGFDSSSAFSTPIGALPLLGGTDAAGATQYRWQVPKAGINLKPPWAADSSSTGTIRWATGAANATSGGGMPFPRYPHAVLRLAPKWGPLYPDTKSWAPPLTSADISAATGAVSSQADYYSPGAWTARDNAPLFASAATQHPTQLWIGRLNYGPGGTEGNAIDDAVTGADYAGSTMRSTGAVGLRWAPNSPTGGGLSYAHALGSAPGGTMWAMSAAFDQELYGYDLRLVMALGSQECGMGLFHNGSGGFPDWQWAGDACADGAGDGRYQMIAADKQQCIMSFPDWWPHNNSYLDAPVVPAMGLLSETIAMSLDLSSRYYGYFSPSRSLRLDEFAAAAADPWALTRVVTYGYNRGPHDGNVWQLACGNAARTTGLASNNLSVTHGIDGAFGYAPQIVDLMRRVGRNTDVYDWGISWGDVQDFLADLRALHYANGIPSNADWTAMTTDLQAAFTKMQGKAPTAGLTATQISFRYNWLTLLRIMKSWLPNPALYLAKGANNNQIDFYQPYTATSEETAGLCSTQNLAPEIYWISPQHPNPTLQQAFPPIGGDGSICSNKGLTATVEVLDDYVGYGSSAGMRVRWALSPGDPSAGGYSLWRDGLMTGGSAQAPVATDWALMADIGASSAPAGGRRYQAYIPPAGIGGAGLRRLYVQADDGAGYRTVGWVDLQFEDCSTLTPTPTPCTPDLGLPAGHGPISCFPDAGSIASATLDVAGGSLSWVSQTGATSDTVGALKYTRTAGSLYYGKLFTLAVPEGNLNGYNQICVKIWNQTGAASPTFEWVSGSGPTLISTAPQMVAPGSGYVTYCWSLQNQASATAGLSLFINTGANPVTNGDYLFDEITLRTTGGVTQADPRCCPSNPPSPTPTRSPTPSASPTRSPSPSPSASPTRSASPTATLSGTPSASPTATVTASPTASVSGTPTGSPSPTASPSVSPSPSASPTGSPSATPTASPGASPSGTPSPSPSATPSVSPSVSASASPSASPTATVTVSPSESPSPPGTLTVTPTSSLTPSATPSATPTASSSASASVTASPSVSSSVSATRSWSPTPSHSASPSVTPSVSVSPTRSATPSASPTATPSPGPSLTLSPSLSPTRSLTPTVTPSQSVSPTVSPTGDRFFQQESLIRVRGLYPNPFSDRLRIYYTLRVKAHVVCTIYNVAGEPIRRLEADPGAGKNEMEWLGDNESGGRCASGVYVLHLDAEGVDHTVDGFWERAAIER